MRFAAGQSDPFRVLVCGGRDFKDAALVDRALSSVSRKHGFLHVIHGGARGADKLADTWACENGCDISEFPANWKADGNAAGPIRNQRMLDDSDPQLVVAFPGGKGTADMIRRARSAGLPVWEPAVSVAKEQMQLSVLPSPDGGSKA